MTRLSTSTKVLQSSGLYSLIAASNEDSEFVYNVKKVAYRHYIEQTWGWDEDFQVNFHRENFSAVNTKIIKVEEVAAGTVDIKEDDRRIFVSGLYLFPQYQGRGIGSAIIEEVMKKGEICKKRVELEVLRVNIKAQLLYKKLGFTMAEGDDTKYFMYKDY